MRERASENPALFITQAGSRPVARTIQKRMEHLARLAGLARHVHPHMFRHAHASDMNLRDPIEVVQESLRHEDISTTRGYVHVAPRLVNRARDRMSCLEDDDSDE